MITISEEKMLQLIELYNNATYEFSKSSKEFKANSSKIAENIEPFAPSIEEFNKYEELIRILSSQNLIFERKTREAETIFKNAKNELLKSLPANKWLKIGKYYVGKRTSDWPGDIGEVVIKKEKPDYQLKHQIIN